MACRKRPIPPKRPPSPTGAPPHDAAGSSLAPVAPSPLPFPRAHVEPFDPVPQVIAHCRRLLADAKSGKLRAMAYATVYRDDLSPAGLVDHGFCAGSGTYYAISHGIRRLGRAWDDDNLQRTTEPHRSA